jgi:hypothetical protein
MFNYAAKAVTGLLIVAPALLAVVLLSGLLVPGPH